MPKPSNLLHAATVTINGPWDRTTESYPRVRVRVEIRATDQGLDVLAERASKNQRAETVVGDSGTSGHLVTVQANGVTRINPHALTYQAEQAYRTKSRRRQLAAGLVTVAVSPLAEG